MRAGWYGKGEIKIRLVLRANDIAGEHDICRRALSPSLPREHQHKKTCRCYQSLDYRQGDSFAQPGPPQPGPRVQQEPRTVVAHYPRIRGFFAGGCGMG
jgi:hypothetical protein